MIWHDFSTPSSISPELSVICWQFMWYWNYTNYFYVLSNYMFQIPSIPINLITFQREIGIYNDLTYFLNSKFNITWIVSNMLTIEVILKTYELILCFSNFMFQIPSIAIWLSTFQREIGIYDDLKWFLNTKFNITWIVSNMLTIEVILIIYEQILCFSNIMFQIPSIPIWLITFQREKAYTMIWHDFSTLSSISPELSVICWQLRWYWKYTNYFYVLSNYMFQIPSIPINFITFQREIGIYNDLTWFLNTKFNITWIVSNMLTIYVILKLYELFLCFFQLYVPNPIDSY